MKHLDQEDLILYHYGEAEDFAACRRHLEACERCRGEYGALAGALTLIDTFPVPERGDEYGAHVWRRLAPRLNEKGNAFHAGLRPRTWSWAVAAALLVMLMAGFLAGRYWRQPAVTEEISAPVRERILLVAVGDHLERSQMMLVELVNAGDGGAVDLSAQRRNARELVADNRLYRRTASGAGDAAVAGLLEELERLLLDIAHTPASVTHEELEEIRRRVEARGLLFKIRVIGSQVREREKAAARNTSQGRT